MAVSRPVQDVDALASLIEEATRAGVSVGEMRDAERALDVAKRMQAGAQQKVAEAEQALRKLKPSSFKNDSAALEARLREASEKGVTPRTLDSHRERLQPKTVTEPSKRISRAGSLRRISARFTSPQKSLSKGLGLVVAGGAGGERESTSCEYSCEYS